ncbi:hypothetical protein [Actinacidiphila sp. bgisy167]|uniref:hypothetical protein n=1 Tax=Actinacidiphila sp. bgisy167 TaxID=3413797 RepID=UPI003D758C8D
MSNRSSQYVRRRYGVPARRDLEIAYWDPAKEPCKGAVVDFRNQYLRVRLDGDKHLSTVHPTWAIIWPDIPDPDARGWCDGCGEDVALRADGTARRHGKGP